VPASCLGRSNSNIIFRKAKYRLHRMSENAWNKHREENRFF
jgi:hypothetical protein